MTTVYASSSDSIIGVSSVNTKTTSTSINSSINLDNKFNEQDLLCGLCFDPLTDENIGINYCCDQTHSSLSCIDCTKSYITNIISNAGNGSCPPITCPMLHSDKKKRILKYEKWKNIVSPDILNKHATLSSTVLHLLCGGCHNQRSIGVKFIECDIDKYKAKIDNEILSCQKDDNNNNNNIIKYLFYDELQQYINGEQNVDEFYNSITNKYLPMMKTGKDKDVLELFENILKIIIDPERRSLLHLRHLRVRSRIWTRCCNRMHCFRCRTKDYHENRTCNEIVGALDGSIIECPSCHTSLVKSEGCNAVTCFCGHNFCWSNEKMINDRAAAFLKLYPVNTSDSCANILCDNDSSKYSNANGWKTRHPIEVNQSLLKWWLKTYSPCPSQACAIIANKNNTEGIRLASNLWETDNSKEVLKCKTDYKYAQESIFTTFYPIESERAVAAVSILKSKRHNHLRTYLESSDIIKSAKIWKENNESCYLNAISKYSKKLSDNFLYLFGNENAYKLANKALISSPQEWNINLSNTQLTYSNDNTSVKRIGSVSCYPACFANLSSERSMITIVLDEVKQGPNWLSFGICTKNFPKTNSDGVGKTRDSWGLCDDRGRNSNEKAHIFSCGKDVGRINKFKLNDKLHCIVDTCEGWCEVSVNDELIHRFDIPVGNFEDYLFGMTFANDHKITMLDDQNISNAYLNNDTNSDHLEMMFHYKKYLKDIFIGKSDLTLSIRDEYASKWDELYDNDMDASRVAIQTTHSELLNNIIGKRTFDSNNNNNNNYLLLNINISWKNILYAICYLNKYNDKLSIKEQEENSLLFILEHGFENSPFMAAVVLSNECQSSNVSITRAKDYMKFNSFVMNEWYDYNMNNIEPLFGLEKVAKTCFCLPRHKSNCPNPNHELFEERLNEKKLLKIALEKELGSKKKTKALHLSETSMLYCNNNEEFGLAGLFQKEEKKKIKKIKNKNNEVSSTPWK
jgi:hypothetical protein